MCTEQTIKSKVDCKTLTYGTENQACRQKGKAFFFFLNKEKTYERNDITLEENRGWFFVKKKKKKKKAALFLFLGSSAEPKIQRKLLHPKCSAP